MDISFPNYADSFKCDGSKMDMPPKGRFFERMVFLKTNPYAYTYTPVIGIWDARILTVFVYNTGEAPIKVHIQNTPDGRHFVNDTQILSLDPDEIGSLVPCIFSKGLRIAGIGGPGTAQIWAQMQM
ncbi:DUF6385 domain-containing protein [Ethanoligenens harbinense]|uniref:DUF6385 domain-containing protein n=1 Tax=Ethanoligenens harbinense (strain DSM 18485 / JCM 12961 / CGMCC 1.5033 / YUAN-3) TaxID=663278 RepID=E6U631_ETHHY|nr:DUF6385 domain-containing protein [Ethanoligenens harbinense]ADU25710.1 hypothetical protein Ethha_0122 [Ethanoligenens harbinense YUAN-3]AVQ94883.1 hypothetical protein CXQ68_00620 [Ethanoligenens harbinense YUAN-3]AYF37574.1 hypothetical protein CXP51_00625 [Ethanoligenens harbinense]AYF40294.1 hypothetical protein CN246_00620 [Ethanoligenens harbinense]QCN91131.1 hypothetical protein DRA42_00635 [Ethanoligenens harbinense]